MKRDGIGGLYRGFLPNAAKNLPNSSIRLSTFDFAKRLRKTGDAALAKEVDALAAEKKAAGSGANKKASSTGKKAPAATTTPASSGAGKTKKKQ